MSALDRPVRVVAQAGGITGLVRPSDVLAALDDEQRAALVGRVLDSRGWEMARSQMGSEVDAVRLIVDAICGKREA